MNATFWEIDLAAAPDVLARLSAGVASVQSLARPIGTLIGTMRLRRARAAEALRPLSTAPRRRTVQLYGPEITFDPSEGYRETGRCLWGIGVHADSGWHIACVSPEGHHAQIWPTHWDSVSKGKL